MTRTMLLTLLLIISCAGAAPAQAPPPHSLRAEVDVMARAAPPFVRDSWVVFSYRTTASARYVALRFEHEGYRVLHPMALNQRNTFVLVYEPPAGLDRLTYRMSVDGLWVRDPANPHFSADAFGTEYSTVDLGDLRPASSRDPLVRADGEVTFTLRSEPGRLVSIAGSFNRWDPFVHPLEETRPGEYSVTLRLPAGEHYYYFLSNGGKLLDPANDDTRRGPQGDLVCWFRVP